MADEIESRRDMLESALEQAEEGTLETPIEKEIETNDDPIQAENAAEKTNSQESDNNRDEKGRFKGKTEGDSEGDSEESTEETLAADSDKSNEEVKRPTTWKKEYVDVWEKMKEGKALNEQEFSKFADYANQREAEYKRGVSA